MKNIRKIFGFLVFFVFVIGQSLNAFAGGNCTLYGMANYARDNVSDPEPLGCYNCEENGDTFSKNYGTCAGVYYNNQVISPDGTTTSVEEFCGEGKYFDYMMGACVDDCHKLFAEPDDENHVCDRTIFSDNYFCQNTDGFSWVIQPENSYTTYATPEDTECAWEDITRCVCMDEYDDGMFSSCESTNGDFVLPSGDTVKESDCINMGNYPDRRLCTCYPPFDARDLCKTSYYYDGSTCVSATACASAGKIANNDNHWCLTPGQVTITLNQNGGSGGLSSIDATSGSAMLPISSSNLPTKTGYNFMGYYTDVNGGSKYYNSNGTSANNCDLTTGTTLYAHWEAKEYTITFDANGGAGGPNPITQKYDSAMRTISVFPTKTGYTFSGYYDTSATSGGNKYYNANGTSAQNWNKVSNTTLYARWKANTYTVTFNKNANDAVNANQVSGYTLVDYVQSSGTGDNTTTGQYIDSGYKPGPNTKVLVDYQLTNASNTGALFGNYSDTGGGASFAFYVTDNYAYAGSTTKITSGVSRDTAIHTVTLDAKSKQFKYGNTVKTISTVSQCSHNMPIFARYYNGEIKYRVSAKIYNFKIYEGEVLVRNFMPAKENSTNTYGLYDMVSDSFFPPTGGNLTGGNESDFVQSVIYGTALPSVTPPTRTGYTFSGYYDAQTGGNQYYNSNGISTQTWTNTSDVTLYAHWTPNTITINWDENGGSTSPSELVEIDDGSCEYGGSLLMPSVELYRTDYVFNGWSL